MADFCRQCTWEIFHEEGSDLNHFGDGNPLEPGYGLRHYSRQQQRGLPG